MAEQYYIIWTYHILLIHLSVDEHGDFFPPFSYCTLVYKYLLDYLLSVLLGIYLECGIAESYANSMFGFLRTHHTVFLIGCPILHSHQQYLRVSISLHPLQCVLFFVLVFCFFL